MKSWQHVSGGGRRRVLDRKKRGGVLLGGLWNFVVFVHKVSLGGGFDLIGL